MKTPWRKPRLACRCALGLAMMLAVSCASLTPQAYQKTYSPAPDRKVDVHLEWKRAPDPHFYTDKGPMTRLTFSERGRQVAVDPSKLSDIEDFWLDEMSLTSPRPGDYRLYLPYGVGERSAFKVLIQDYRVTYP